VELSVCLSLLSIWESGQTVSFRYRVTRDESVRDMLFFSLRNKIGIYKVFLLYNNKILANKLLRKESASILLNS